MPNARTLRWSFEISLVYAVFPVELAHQVRVDPDDDDVDRQRALRRKPERKRPAKKRDLVQIAREPDFDKRSDEPDQQKNRSDDEILAPVLVVSFRKLHGSSPPLAGTRANNGCRNLH